MNHKTAEHRDRPSSAPHAPFAIRRFSTKETGTSAEDQLAVEEPLEIRVEGRSVALTMRTPGHDEELAMGFLFTEGVLASIDDVLDLDTCSATDGGPGNILNVKLRDSSAVNLEKLSRHVFTASSCGLCGKATIEAIRTQLPLAERKHRPLKIRPDTLLGLPSKLHAAQSTFHSTGGLHAAALFDATGSLHTVREDVGRHNAVDKVLGRLLLDRGSHHDELGLLVSGRIAFEIVQKSLSARIGTVAGISAPTSLAVDLARESDQTLVGFLRGERFNLYSGQLGQE